MIIDGRSRAADILDEVRRAVSAHDRVPQLCAITVSPNAATHSYLNIKKKQAESAGMTLSVVELPDDATTQNVMDAIGLAAAASDSLIVQLPLPAHIDTRAVLDSIPTAQDADVLSSSARMAFEQNIPGALIPPVASAMLEILRYAGVRVAGKRAVVVGDGWLVGNPCAVALRHQGAFVKSVTLEQGSLELLQDADIIVAGAGVPHLIQPSMLTEDTVLIDAGTSESGGVIVGDFDPACSEVAAVFTPVPGGVGPVAVASLFRNVLRLLEKG